MDLGQKINISKITVNICQPARSDRGRRNVNHLHNENQHKRPENTRARSDNTLTQIHGLVHEIHPTGEASATKYSNILRAIHLIGEDNAFQHIACCLPGDGGPITPLQTNVLCHLCGFCPILFMTPACELPE